MDKRFSHIDADNEKVHRIIDYGFKEFSENDFEKASTNNIVKQANISRGLLYYYFKDKRELYDYLVEYSVKTSVYYLVYFVK